MICIAGRLLGVGNMSVYYTCGYDSVGTALGKAIY